MHARQIFFGMFLVCAALLGYGYYLEHGQGLEPCPLCIFQRLCFLVVGAIALVAALHDPETMGRRLYAVLASVAAVAGGVFATRQVWLQHLPPEKVPACGPGLEYWMQTLPLSETIRKVLRGTGDCAEVDWTLLGLSIAEWSLLAFIALFTACLMTFGRSRARIR